jgi:tetratricopeptide (TPR) repeat protein
LKILGGDRLDPDIGTLHQQLAQALSAVGDDDGAVSALESALRIAQALSLPEVLSYALTVKAGVYLQAGRVDEAGYLYAGAVDTAERHRLTTALSTAQANLSNLTMQWDRPDAAEQCQAALTLSRRLGDRYGESIDAGNLMTVQLVTGRWEELERLAGGLLENHENRPGVEHVHVRLVILNALRGQLGPARAHLEQARAWRDSDNEETHSSHAALRIIVHVAAGELEDALTLGLEMLPHAIRTLGASHEAVRFAWPDALHAALDLGRLEAARRLLALLADQPPGHIPPYHRAHLARGRGLLAAATGEHASAETDLTAAIDAFHALAYPYWRAVTQTDLAACLTEQERGSDATALLTQAIPILQTLAAAPALARADQITATAAGTISI